MMRLLKFLSVGRAWVGQRNEIGRYRMSSRHLLPRFESGPAEPCAANPQVQSNAVSETKKNGLLNRIWSSCMNPFHRKSDARARAVFASPPQAEQVSRVEANETSKKLIAVSPLQGELALDQVAVVRNDLALDDLEFAPRGRRKMPGTDSDFGKVAERHFQRGRGMPWNQLTAKLFVAGRSRFQ